MEPDLSPAELEAAAASALSASDILTDVIISRLIRQVDASGTTFRANVSGWVDGLAAARSSFRASLGRLCAYRSQWLDKELEELDGVEKLLAAAARLCDSEGLNCVIVDASVSPLLVLTTACDTLPRHSCVLSMIADGRQVVASLLHSRARAMPTGDLLSTFAVSGPGVAWCRTGRTDSAHQQNTMLIACLDECGDGYTGMEAGDVMVTILASRDSAGAPVDHVAADPVGIGLFQCSYIVPLELDTLPNVLLEVRVFGALVYTQEVRVGGPIEGVWVSTIPVPVAREPYGIAVSRDGAILAVADRCKINDQISLYALPDGTFLRTMGGGTPNKLCFAPNGNLLVAENGPATGTAVRFGRVREVTLSGTTIRLIGESAFRDAVRGVDASNSLIAVASYNGPTLLHTFDIHTGALVCEADSRLGAGGFLMGCLSVRFTPDGSHLIVAEGNNNRVTILTSACVFVRFLGVQALRWPRDAVCGPDGSVIIADADHNRICVYPFQGAEEMTESFGEKGDTVEGATFGDIAAFAVHRRRLYVLDEEHCRVKVLE